jgi:predicted kinase
MELQLRCRLDLSAYFLSCFALFTNDYSFFPLLDMYVSYRAWVRAKVACFVAADLATPPKKRLRKATEARRLMELAASFIEAKTPRRLLVAIGGIIGTGKSTLADRLAQMCPVVVVSSDRTRKHLAGFEPLAHGHAGLYNDDLTRATYDEIIRRARDVLDSGRTAVLDATFRNPQDRAAVRAVALSYGVPFLFVELTADDDVLRARLAARDPATTVSDATAALLAPMRADWHPATELPSAERCVLRSEIEVDEQALEVLNRILSLMGPLQ